MAKTSFTTKLVTGILGVAVMSAVVAVATGEDASKVVVTPEQQKQKDMLAKIEVVEFSGKRLCLESAKGSLSLKDPKSAEWATPSGMALRVNKDATWTTQARVSAANSFNARTTTIIECTMRLKGEVWSLLRVKII